jgi:hypothetical protein
MRRLVLTIALLVAALSYAGGSAAQELPQGGYYADGAYYLPEASAPAAAATAAPATTSACPVGSGLPIMYVAQTATMVRIQWVWSVGGDAPGFPYVPVYSSQAQC